MKHLPITLLSLLASASVFAQTGGNDPVLATPAFAGADCVTLLDSTAVQVAETGSGTFTVHKKFKVQTEKGAVANHVVKYDYDPLTAFAEFRYATIYREGGDVVNVDVTQACDYAAPARAIYWGARQIMLDLGRLNPGDVVEYEIANWPTAATMSLASSLRCADSSTTSFLSGQRNRPSARSIASASR